MAPERPPYDQTLFDREGPDAANSVKARLFGIVAGAMSCLMFYALASVLLNLSAAATFAVTLIGGVGMGVLATKIGRMTGSMAADSMKVVLAGAETTPYSQQHSYQQALVMQGRVDEAIESLEAWVAEPNATVDVRIRAAELHTREAGNHKRAAELFREASRHPACTVGEEVYSANRLVDMLSGPLNEPGRALVELRRLIDRYPDGRIGQNARAALQSLKTLQKEQANAGEAPQA